MENNCTHCDYPHHQHLKPFDGSGCEVEMLGTDVNGKEERRKYYFYGGDAIRKANEEYKSNK